METRELPPDYPLHHARMSVSQSLELEGHLLTCGEAIVARHWMLLSDDAAHVHARLYGRKTQPVRIDGFHPPILTPLSVVLEELQQAGLIDTNEYIPLGSQLPVWRIPELRAECRRTGKPSRGTKQELIERLLNDPLGFKGRLVPVVRIRHQRLFRRIHRGSLHDHQGDLTKIVLSDMGLRKSVPYKPTCGPGRYPNRSALLGYENALNDAKVPDSLEHARKQGTDGIRELGRIRPPDDIEWRFSGHRFRHRQVELAAIQLERSDAHIDAAKLYEEMLRFRPQKPTKIAQRLAICLDRMGQPQKGMELCLRYAGDDPESYSLIRTGRRLARRCGMKWTGYELPKTPPSRRITLPYPQTNGKWMTEDGPRRIEGAVLHHLGQDTSQAFHSENGLWSTLFGLLFTDAMFATVPGMLPIPHLSKPIDLYGEGFRARREAMISTTMGMIECGRATDCVTKNHKRFHGQTIAGVSWSRYSLEQLGLVCNGLPPKALAFIMNRFVDCWQSAAKGMPDLTILPNEKSRLVDWTPNKIFLAEVKGPGDALRDHQRWWIHQLNRHGITTEVWHVQSAGG